MAENVPPAHFYQEVVGLNKLPHHADIRIYFDLDGCVLTIVPGRPALPPDPEPLFPVVTFSVPQLDKAVDTLRLYGVDLRWGVEKNAASRQGCSTTRQGTWWNWLNLRNKSGHFRRPYLHNPIFAGQPDFPPPPGAQA
jgi:hypothetical protein